MSDIGARIKRLIDESGLTQRELARKAGVHEVSISKIVNGSRQPQMPLLSKLAQALGIPLSALLGEEEPQVEPERLPADYDEAEERVLDGVIELAQRAPTPQHRVRLWRRVARLVRAGAGGDGRFRRPQARCAARPGEGDIIRRAG